MLPADSTLRAAQRWLDLLTRSTSQQATSLLRSDRAYADYTQTQYASALEWLMSTGLLIRTSDGFVPSARATGSPGQIIYAAALRDSGLPWLAESDNLIADPDDLPVDAAGLAHDLGLSDSQALLAIRQVHGQIDLAERARIGSAGEHALVALLEQRWPGSTRHVALVDDGLGYDVEFDRPGDSWHLEVKTTTRRGRLTIHLSRHELEVARLDPAWRLIVVGLDDHDRLAALAWVSTSSLTARAPRDHHVTSRWESARYHLDPDHLVPGLPFLNSDDRTPLPQAAETGSAFSWMPTLPSSGSRS